MVAPRPHLSLPALDPRVRSLDVIPAHTRSLVFSVILSCGLASRTQVAQLTGLSPSTVTKVVAPLVAADYLVEVGAARAGVGRPQRMLAVNRDRHAVIGLKLHPAHVTGVRTDLGCEVTARASRRLGDHDLDRTLDAAADVVRELLEPGGDALGLGVALGGHVDSDSGVLLRSGVLGWDHVDVAGPLARATGLPTVVNNDLNALVVAERRFGKGRDVRSFAVVSIGAGVGCGLFLEGSLYAGTTGLAGELGHIPLQAGGPRCSCGNDGCLEAIASTDAILRGIRERGGPDCDHVEAMRLAREAPGGDGDAARDAFATAGAALGRGLAVLCNLLNLERIVLTGEGVVAYDLLGQELEAALRAHAFSTAARDCELLVDVVNDDLWARGAASLVIHEALERVDRTAATHV